MLKKTITYTDFNDLKRTEDFWFHLTKAELAEMEATTPGGLATKLQKISSMNNQPEMARVIKQLILKTYGEKSEDGRRFIKSKELSNAFAQTEAYSELYMEIMSNADFAIQFLIGILPNEFREAAEKELATNPQLAALRQTEKTPAVMELAE